MVRMKLNKKSVSFEGITLQMTSSLNLQEVLTTITQGLVDELEAAFARIWLLGPGDLCAECYKADSCSNREQCLHLKASAGLYTRINGEYRRVPLGAFKIGTIAQSGEPLATNDVLGDDRLPNKKWLKENRLQSFAGHPLIFRGELLGMIAMFSRRVMRQEEFDSIAVFANQAAIAIKNAQLFSEVVELKNRLQAENIYLQEEIKLDHNFDEIISTSTSFKKALRNVEQVASTDATVLILGETGTGKELIARALHTLSRRKERPLVKVNCAALPANLIESELFGHEKGAFTGALGRKIGRFELADRGTIFLDEIGDLPLDLQAKMLRVLQEGEFERVGGTQTLKVDVRVIAATNRDLKQATRVGEFREDLFYRLNVFPITLPPLRERREDIPLLINHFIKKYGAKLGKKIFHVPQKVMKTLQAYHFPGNVRELENIVERAIILAKDETLQMDESLELLKSPSTPALNAGTLEEVERKYIVSVLQETNWRIEGPKGAALRLGINSNTLRSRMQKLGIRKPA